MHYVGVLPCALIVEKAQPKLVTKQLLVQGQNHLSSGGQVPHSRQAGDRAAVFMEASMLPVECAHGHDML